MEDIIQALIFIFVYSFLVYGFSKMYDEQKEIEKHEKTLIKEEEDDID